MAAVAFLSGALLAPAPAVSADPAASEFFDLGENQRVELRLVRAGAFDQGSPDSEANRSDEEYQRRVTLTRDYYLGATEVTVGQFRRFVAAANYRTEAERGQSGGFGWDGSQLVQRREFNWRNPGFSQTDAHPVTGVTYDDALAFCSWLSQRTEDAFDLPTEAQWEFAARAGEATAWPGGADPDDVAWHKGMSPSGTHPVGRLKPNALGFYDLGGNAAEWCRDWYGPYAGGGAAGLADRWAANPPVGDKPRRVLRGGSWLREAKHARVAARYRNDPKSRNADNGFRLFHPVRNSAASPATRVSPPPPAAAVALPSKPANAAPRPAPINRPPPGGVLVAPLVLVQTGGWIGPAVAGIASLGCVGLVIGLIWVIIRTIRRSKPAAAEDSHTAIQGQKTDQWVPSRILPPEAVVTEAQDDGFRMLLSGVAAGELVRYSATVAGQTLTDTVAYEPGGNGQFIFTGARPESVIIHGIAAGSENAMPGQSTLRDAGPGGLTRAGMWANPGVLGDAGPARPTGCSGRRPGAYE